MNRLEIRRENVASLIVGVINYLRATCSIYLLGSAAACLKNALFGDG